MRLAPLPVGDPAALVQAWLLRFPADYWYRDRYKIPLFGPDHKDTDLRAPRAEYEQERLVRRLRAAAKPGPELNPDQLAALPLFKNPSAAAASISATQAELDAEIAGLNLADFDDPAASPSPTAPAPH